MNGYLTDWKHFETAQSLKSKNVQLTVETEKLKEENFGLQIKVEQGWVLITIIKTDWIYYSYLTCVPTSLDLIYMNILFNLTGSEIDNSG